jgi:hypothetical protein
VFAQTVETSSDASAGLGLGLSLIILLFSLALLAFHIYVLVDMLKFDDAAWLAAGQNKVLWIVLWVIIGFFCCAPLIDLIYWLAIRPKLQAAGSGPPGYPPPGYPS